MNRARNTLFMISFLMVGGLFFMSGFIMSRGLLHAKLPSHSKQARTPDFNIETIVSTQTMTDFPNKDTDFYKASLETLSGFCKRKVKRTPSSNIEQKKKDPLMRIILPPKRKVSNNLASNDIFYVMQ